MRLIDFERESFIGMSVVRQPRVSADQRVVAHGHQRIVGHERLQQSFGPRPWRAQEHHRVFIVRDLSRKKKNKKRNPRYYNEFDSSSPTR